MKHLTINYTDKRGKQTCTQTFTLSDFAAKKLKDELDTYEGGEVEVDTMMFNLLTACTYLSKLEGFVGTPNFDIVPPEWMIDSFDLA